MRISENGLEIIKKYEGCRLTAYRCPSNILTIGWGHTKDVYEGQTITQEQADRMLIDDVKRYEPSNDYGFNQNQYDSLTSFSYNCGAGAMQNVIDSGNITYEMSNYINGNFGPLEGLKRRRKEEIELFNTPVEENIYSYEEIGVATVVCDILNIRNKPSLAGAIQDNKYYRGEQIVYSKVYKNDGFYWIEYKRFNGEYGYCASRKVDNTEIYLNCV